MAAAQTRQGPDSATTGTGSAKRSIEGNISDSVEWLKVHCGVCHEAAWVLQGEVGKCSTLEAAANAQRAVSVCQVRPPPGPMGIPQTCTQGCVVCRTCTQKAWKYGHNWGTPLYRCLVCGHGDEQKGRDHYSAWLVEDVPGWIQWVLGIQTGP